MQQSNNQRVIFLHIPKTAGTTIKTIAFQQYKKQERLIIPEKNIRRAIQNNAHRDLRYIQGHVPFGIHKHFKKPFTYITMLRDPIDRVISEYHFIRHNPRHELYHVVHKNKISLINYINIDKEEFTSRTVNKQTHLLSGGNIADLEQAKENIQKHFTVVGFVEEFEKSLRFIQQRLGWQTFKYMKKNVNHKKPLKGKIDKKVRNMIASKNQLDIELYEWCRKAFDEQTSKI